MVAISNNTMVAGCAALLAGLTLAGAAQAQTMSSNSASMNAGYGRTSGQENRIVDSSTRDANGNRVIIDGIIQTGSDQSVISRMSGGVFNSSSGVGGVGDSSTAIGNNLVVVTQGSWNTVIINSSQTNNGNVSASSNGGVGGN